VSWRYLIYVLEIIVGVVEIFDGFPGDILWVSWRYFVVVLEIFDRCPQTFDRCPLDI